MKDSKILLSLALALILSGTPTFAAPPSGSSHPGLFQLMGPSGISGNQQHLYVLAGGKIMQYSLADLQLVKSVALPRAEAPGEVKSKGKTEQGKFSPPPMPGPHGIWAGESSLYVLSGPMIYQYSIPDLTLKTSVALPKPEL